MHRHRDMGINYIKARKDHRCYGMGLGIIILDDVYPQVAVDFYHAHPNMGAMLLECTGMQPFARAVQREIDVPIFSWGTLLDYAYSVVVHRDYYGHV